MNNIAKKFGLNNTNYSNPHGLNNKNNVSTAIDQCKLGYHCMNNEIFRQIVKSITYKCRSKATKQSNSY